ncbi:hypothetical protein ACFW4X_08810 [Streptomyces smyrnaeus]|nr:hypothetical protein [Streptomyces smyrnaeus]
MTSRFEETKGSRKRHEDRSITMIKKLMGKLHVSRQYGAYRLYWR